MLASPWRGESSGVWQFTQRGLVKTSASSPNTARDRSTRSAIFANSLGARRPFSDAIAGGGGGVGGTLSVGGRCDPHAAITSSQPRMRAMLPVPAAHEVDVVVTAVDADLTFEHEVARQVVLRQHLAAILVDARFGVRPRRDEPLRADPRTDS